VHEFPRRLLDHDPKSAGRILFNLVIIEGKENLERHRNSQDQIDIFLYELI
jgi:hypothetical protein